MTASPSSPKTSRSFFATPLRIVLADCSGDWAPGGASRPAQIAVTVVPGVAEVETDVLVPQLVAEGEGQPVQGGLSGGVHRLLGHRVERDAGYDVDNVPAVLRRA